MTDQLTTEQGLIIESMQHQLDVTLELIELIQKDNHKHRISLEDLNQGAPFDGVSTFSEFFDELQCPDYTGFTTFKLPDGHLASGKKIKFVRSKSKVVDYCVNSILNSLEQYDRSNYPIELVSLKDRTFVYKKDESSWDIVDEQCIDKLLSVIIEINQQLIDEFKGGMDDDDMCCISRKYFEDMFSDPFVVKLLATDPTTIRNAVLCQLAKRFPKSEFEFDI